MDINKPAFGLYVALASGGNLIALPDGTTGIAENSDINVSIYPNPASDFINIRNDGAAVEKIRLINSSGAIVRDMIADQGSSITINVSALTPGLYYLLLEGTGSAETRPVMIMR